MNNEKTIKLDSVTMHRATDGTVTIVPKAGGGCVNMGLLITTAIIALLGVVMTVSGVIQLFNPESESNSGVVVFGLFVTALFGGFAYYLYLKMRYGQKKEPITITPILNVIKIGDRTIPFNDVVNISAEEIPAIIEGAGVAIFLFVLSDGKVVEVGRVTTETGKLDKQKEEVITFLKQAIKRS